LWSVIKPNISATMDHNGWQHQNRIRTGHQRTAIRFYFFTYGPLR